MQFLKPVLLSASLATSMLGGAAAATERPPRIGEQKIVHPQADKASVPAPAKKPAKRRAVRQILDDDIRPAAPSAAPPAVYSPQLTVPAVQPRPGLPPAPVTLNCVGASCTDAAGGRFNGGIGTTLISPQGRLCTDNGLTVQCH